MGTNLAIEYDSKIHKVKSKIELLNSIGIKGEGYLKKLAMIQKKVSEQIDNYNEEAINNQMHHATLNSIYIGGMTGLDGLIDDLLRYDDYISGYHYCEYLESKIFGETLPEQELNEYVDKIMDYIHTVNNDDTSYDYEDKKEIIEKIFSMAYQIMKLEFVILGKSRIFKLAKEDKIIEAFINSCIERDIDTIKKNGKDTKLINLSISKIQSEGINATYLDEILITLLALEDDILLINKIKDQLISLASQIRENSHEIESTINNTQCTCVDVDRTIDEMRYNRGSNTRELAKRVVAGLGAGVVLGASFGLARVLSKPDRRYKTTKEIYSSTQGNSVSEVYETELPGLKDTRLYVYSPYEKDTITGNYKRDYIVYDIDNISSNCETLDDYLNLNLDHAGSVYRNPEYKGASEMTEDDFYDEVIYEVVKLIQDPNVEITSSTEIFLKVMFTLFLEGLYGCFLWIECKALFKSFRSNKSNKYKLRDYLITLKRRLEVFRRLMDNNEELRSEFTKLYGTYGKYLESRTFERVNEEISIPDPQIELDKRMKRLLRTKVKDVDLS